MILQRRKMTRAIFCQDKVPFFFAFANLMKSMKLNISAHFEKQAYSLLFHNKFGMLKLMLCNSCCCCNNNSQLALARFSDSRCKMKQPATQQEPAQLRIQIE